MLDHPAENERAFEHLLRDNGFSRTRAKTIISKGFKGGDLDSISPQEIASLIAEVKRRQHKLERKNFLSSLKKITPYYIALSALESIGKLVSEELNQVSVMPGQSASGRILPVSPGRVTFRVSPPTNMPDAQFKWSIRYYEFVNGKQVSPAVVTKDHTDTSITVDRGFMKGLVPNFKVQDVVDYYDDLLLNLFLGTTVATIKFMDFPDGHRHQIKKTKGVFKITVVNHVVEQMKVERMIEQYRRKHPELFD